ncbi:MAG: NUDIX hydrolase [Actinomycetota bacterium]|nr:NUDIX hydrolase [Actinomycetota bacterium]MCL6093658.1 NUDIX hydrolase [Actinomycetota bacterium]MDA8167162.1 NUDIX hydrolase [Actinomycetota bacterium]
MNNKVLSTSRIYDGRIINLRLDEVELPDGRHARREVVEHPGASVIVPVDQQGRVYLVRQYRDAAAEELLELPAGKLEPGEEPLACARRECLEELGLEAGSWTHLASFYSSPGFCDELLHCFLARELRQGVSDADRDEFLTPESWPLANLAELLGQLKDAKSIAGLLLARQALAEE